MVSYSTYEAKARLSEILRRVRGGETVSITYYGEEIAEVRPVARQEDDAALFRRLEDQGLIEPRRGTSEWKPLARRPGALERFLEDRE